MSRLVFIVEIRKSRFGLKFVKCAGGGVGKFRVGFFDLCEESFVVGVLVSTEGGNGGKSYRVALMVDCVLFDLWVEGVEFS